MKTEYNSQAFSPEEVEKGLHLKLVNTLLEINKENDKYYNDIHITSDSYCTIIEWIKIPYDHEWGGRFEYVGDEQEVATIVQFPDNHYDYAFSEDEENKLVQDFINQNKEWRRDSSGTWINNQTGERKY